MTTENKQHLPPTLKHLDAQKKIKGQLLPLKTRTTPLKKGLKSKYTYILCSYVSFSYMSWSSTVDSFTEEECKMKVNPCRLKWTLSLCFCFVLLSTSIVFSCIVFVWGFSVPGKTVRVMHLVAIISSVETDSGTKSAALILYQSGLLF